MKKPIRTTLFFGLISALCFIPISQVLTSTFGWLMAHKIYFLLNIILYSVLLCRWSRTPLVSILFPLLLLLGVAVWPHSHTGFMLVALAVFSWIRSGICFKNAPLRAIIAEIVAIVGGAGFILFWWPGSILTQPLAIWLFFLIQTLYFYIIPGSTKRRSGITSQDSFEQACREMERLLNNSSPR